MLIQRSFLHILKKKIDILSVVEVSIELDDVGMVESILYF